MASVSSYESSEDSSILKENIKWQIVTRTHLSLKYAIIFSDSVAEGLFWQLEKEVEYYNQTLLKVNIYDKWYNVPRKIGAYGDEGIDYVFSGIHLRSKPWSPTVLQLKKCVERLTRETYNFVLVNRYANGKDYIGEHRDDEKDLVVEAPIASLSLGEPRDFRLRHMECRGKFPKRDIPPIKITLQHGSLLLMEYPTNLFWYHSLPIRKKSSGVRINLTFRKMRQSK